MSDRFVEVDLGRFGNIELEESAKLLTKYAEKDFAENSEGLGDNIKLCFNANSGYVFLSDGDYRVLMLNDDDKLEEWLNCEECGEEDFKSEFIKVEPTYYYQLHIQRVEDENVFFYSTKNEITVSGILDLAVERNVIDRETRDKMVIDTVKEITLDDYNELSDDFIEPEENVLRCPSCHKKL